MIAARRFLNRWFAAVGEHPIVAVLVVGGLVAVILSLASHPWTATSFPTSGTEVWVTNSSATEVNRISLPAHAYDATVEASPNVAVDQSADQTLIDQAGALTGLDPATMVKSQSVEVPNRDGSAQVAMDDGVVAASEVVGGATKVYLGSMSGGQPALDGSPSITFPGTGEVAIGADGTVVAHADQSGKFYVVPAGVSATSVQSGPATNSDHAQLVVVADKGVLLANKELAWSDGTVTPLARLGQDPQLEQGAPEGSQVLVATDSGLMGISDGSSPVVLDRVGGAASPVRPAGDASGCAFGAWQLPTARFVETCPNGTHVDSTLEGAHGWGSVIPPTQFPSLVFRTGGTEPVLNDTSTGDAFEVVQDSLFVVPWQEVDAAKSTSQVNPSLRNPKATPLTIVIPPPRPFQVREGTVAYLPVLTGDYDSAGDELFMDQVTPTGVPSGDVSLSQDHTKVVVDLGASSPAPPAGTQFDLSVKVDNGRGITAQAVVPVTVIAADAPGLAPALLNPSTAPTVFAQNGQAQYDVLRDWYSPEGTPIVVSGVQVLSGTVQAHATPTGWVDFSGFTGTQATVRVDVSSIGGLTSSYVVTVKAVEPTGAPVVTDDVVVGMANTPVTAHPLASDVDPAGGTLSIVPGSVQPVPNGGQPANALQVNGGALTFTGPAASYSYSYQAVSSVSHESTVGYVRFNIQESPISLTPLAVNVPVGGSATIDLLADASDLSGSVLAVTSVEPVGTAPPGLFTELSANKQLEVTATSGRAGELAEYTYTVSDGGVAPAESQLYVLLTAPPIETVQAAQVNASVVAGNVVTLPVLTNAWSSLGLPLSVSPNVTVIQGQGYAWTDGTSVRFRAGTQPGVVVIAYEVVDDPQPGSVQASASALAVVNVTAPPASAQPPQAEDLQVRVALGQKVVIPVPLTTNTVTGLPIDPNGLSVRLNGFTLQSRTSAQTTGKVALDPDGVSFDYTAPQTAGTDAFEYTLEDSMGVESAPAQVTVVIFQPPAGVVPTTVPSTYHLGYGASAVLPVLDQASDPSGESLSLRIQPSSDQQALQASATADQQMHVQVPSTCPAGHQEGPTGCVFTVFYVAYALQTSNLTPVTIVVDGTSTGLPPVAPDVYPAYSSNKSTVTVQLGQYVTDPSGPVSALQLSFPDGGATHVGLTVTAELADEPEPLLYEVTDPLTKLSASAVIWLPGLKQVEPVVRSDVAPVQLDAGGPGVQVPLDNYFSVPSGYTVDGQAAQSEPAGIQVTGSGSSVTISADSSTGGPYDVEVAVHASGQSNVVDLPIPVQVKGTISTPITVYAPTVQVSLDQTTTQSISLLQNVSDPAAQPSQLVFHLGASSDSRVTYQQTGSTVAITANGTSANSYGSSIPVTVSFGSQSKQFTIDVTAQPINLTFSLTPFSQTIDVGTPTTFSLAPYVSAVATVASQDQWHVTSVSGEPSGWTASPSGTSITVDATTFQGSTQQLSFTVAANSNSSQTADGTVSITTQSKPGPPTNVTATALPQGNQIDVNVSWSPPTQTGGNLPISYAVQGAGGCTPTAGATQCTVTKGVSDGQSYTFTVTASNSIGSSEASKTLLAPSEPGPPVIVSATAGGGSVSVTWAPPSPPTTGTAVAISGYSVSALDITTGAPPLSCGEQVPPNATTYSCTGLANGDQYRISVATQSQLGSEAALSSPQTPYAAPSAPGMPQYIQTYQTPDKIAMSWDPSVQSGAQISGYTLTCQEAGGACTDVDIDQPQGTTAAATATVSGDFGQMLQFIVAVQYVNPNDPGTILTSPTTSSSPVTPQVPPTWSGAPAEQTGLDVNSASLDWQPDISTNGANVTYTLYEGVGQPGNTAECQAETQLFSQIGTPNDTVSGLAAGKTYCFQIEADYAIPNGPSGKVMDPTVTPVTTDPQTMITQVAVCAVSAGNYQMTWNSSNSSATYSVFESDSSLNPFNLPTPTATGLTVTSFPLTADATSTTPIYVGVEPDGFNPQLAATKFVPASAPACSTSN